MEDLPFHSLTSSQPTSEPAQSFSWNSFLLCCGTPPSELVPPPLPQIYSRSEDGDLPLPVLDRQVTPLLPTRSRLLICRPSSLAFRPCLRYVVFICDTHMLCVWLSIVLFLPLFILLWSRKMIVRQQGSLSGSRPISEEFPVLQKTSFITISDREGFQTSYWWKDHYWGKFRLTLGIDLRRLLPHWKRLLLYRLWLQLPRRESSLRSSEMWGIFFWMEKYMRGFPCHLRQGDQFLHI